MVIEEIEKKILSCAERQKREIIERAEKQRSEKVGEANEEIEREQARLLTKGEQEAKRERNMLISEANLAAKRNLLDAKESLIESVLEKVKAKLEKHTREKGYAKTLEKLAKECREELGDDAAIYVRKEDLKMLKGAEAREMAPGVIGESKDGGLYLDNTFVMILKRNKEEIRKEIGRELFK